jgi:hypothetical protein
MHVMTSQVVTVRCFSVEEHGFWDSRARCLYVFPGQVSKLSVLLDISIGFQVRIKSETERERERDRMPVLTKACLLFSDCFENVHYCLQMKFYLTSDILLCFMRKWQLSWHMECA